MKKTIFAALMLALACTTFAVAQDQDRDRDRHEDRQDQDRATHAGREMSLTGWIHREDDHYVLESDQDHQRYRIQNTEAVREHEGHHVQVNARMHEDNHSLEINQVNMLSEHRRGNDDRRDDDRRLPDDDRRPPQ